MPDHLWCPSCDRIVVDPGVCACGSRPVAVAHGLDMVELLIAAQALTGLVTLPPGFDPDCWDIDALKTDIDARDEILAEIAATSGV